MKNIILAVALLAASLQIAAQTTIEEIVVTAQKRTETLMDVPLSITVFSGESLEQDSISSLQDIGSQTPGLVFTAFSVGQPEISIRGISTKEDGASANDSSVVSVDDVYIAARTAQVFDIFDLERVEVLRGPQGTLYGKNSIGGSINFVTLKPSQEKVIRVSQSVGNYERADTGMLISGPVSEELAAKFSLSRRSHGGYIDNLLTGEDQGESETYALRGQAVWTPSSELEFIGTLDGAIDHNGATNREPIGSTGPLHNCGCASDPMAVNQALGGAGDAFTSLAETEGYMDREVFGASLKATWDFSERVSLVSITAYRDSDFDWREDSEGLPPSSVFINLGVGAAVYGPLLVGTPASAGFTFDINNYATEQAEQFTQEFRVLSTGTSRLRWLGGFFYSLEDIDRTESFKFPSLAIGTNSDFERSIQQNETTSIAVYGQGQYDVTEQLTATLGLRYSTEDKEADVGAEILNSNPAAVLLRGAPFPDTNGDKIRDGLAHAEVDFDNISWRFALDYAINDDITVFSNIATGFKSGGFSGSPSTQAVATTPFGDEEAISYEFGLKSRLMEDRMMFNASGFFVDYADLQVTRFFQPVGSSFGEFITENAGEAEIMGVELEVLAIPMEGVEIGGNYAWLDANYTDFQGLPSIEANGSITDPGFFNGKDLRIAPENTASGWLMLDHPLANGGALSGKFKIRYQDKLFFDPDNNPINISDSYVLLDAWAAYTTPNQRWQVKFWIKNIGDEEYVTHGFTQRGNRIAFGLFGEPRTFGGTLTFNY